MLERKVSENMTPAVKPIEVLPAVDEWNFP